MDGSFGPQHETLTFQSAPKAAELPEPEWSLSAGQVALIVAAIFSICELIGMLY